MTPKHLKLAIKIAIKADVPLWIHGTAGIGKSEIIESVAKALGYHVIDLRLATQEVVDLIGRVIERAVAWDDKGNPTEFVSTWAMPEWVWEVIRKWEDENIPTLVFMDEMNRALHDVIQSVYQFVLKKQIHTHILPDVTRVIVAGNPPSDKYDVAAMDDSMDTRFCHVLADVDTQQWLDDFAFDNCVEEIQRFIASVPYQLCCEPGNKFEATSLAVNRPRTWKFASDLYKVLDQEDLVTSEPEFSTMLLGGVVGIGSAHEFISSMRDGWYTIEDVLSGNVSWSEIRGKGTADIRLFEQMGRILRYDDLSSTDRKDCLIQFLVDASGTKKDLVLGVLKNMCNRDDEQLVDWITDQDDISDLLMQMHDAMTTIHR